MDAFKVVDMIAYEGLMLEQELEAPMRTCFGGWARLDHC